MTRLLVATGNPGKLAEFRALLVPAVPGLTLVGTETVAGWTDPVEDGDSFTANALIKARAGAAASGLPTLADDSGLCVDALNRMPGIFSARWAGGHGDDVANRRLLLDQLREVPAARRGAHFGAVLALVVPGGGEHTTQGVWPGRIAFEELGGNGFGYDPVFLPADGGGLSSAQLGADLKNAISHRGLAVGAALPSLRALVAGEDAPIAEHPATGWNP